MYALEFEADIRDKALPLPAEVASQVNQGQHVRVILLLDEATPTQTAKVAVKNPLAALLTSGSRRAQDAQQSIRATLPPCARRLLYKTLGRACVQD
jgi:hypothetical protein